MFVLRVLVWTLQHAADEMMDDLLGDPPPGKSLRHLPCEVMMGGAMICCVPEVDD